ncbi:MAG: PhoH family protein [Solobacterium sp.]|nr:PhoH family protein [Solobacterium sp.]
MQHFTYRLKEIDTDELLELSGINDSNLKYLKEIYGCDISIRNSNVLFFKEDEEEFRHFKTLMDNLLMQIKAHNPVDINMIKQLYLNINEEIDLKWQSQIAGYTVSNRPIRFKTYNQYRLSDSIKHNDLVFSLGPAGTGKTFVAVLCACQAFKNGDIKKIILTRPAVEAGESLGFLPGDLKEKVDPYLMPLYDALYEIMGSENVDKMLEKNQIEIIPLAYMRGRTLNDAFVILDEAQNTTAGQMLMFLTRLGRNSKMVVNGDLSQIDLNLARTRSGLKVASEKLRNIKGISFNEFDRSDVVRHPLVEKIIENFVVD